MNSFRAFLQTVVKQGKEAKPENPLACNHITVGIFHFQVVNAMRVMDKGVALDFSVHKKYRWFPLRVETR